MTNTNHSDQKSTSSKEDVKSGAAKSGRHPDEETGTNRGGSQRSSGDNKKSSK
jgi:hypothetical protein